MVHRMRTFPLVVAALCTLMTTGHRAFAADPQEQGNLRGLKKKKHYDNSHYEYAYGYQKPSSWHSKSKSSKSKSMSNKKKNHTGNPPKKLSHKPPNKPHEKPSRRPPYEPPYIHGGQKPTAKPGLGWSQRPTFGTKLQLTITNLAAVQPFSEFFVMVHSFETEPLFELGEPASEALSELAETGSADALVQYYTNVAPEGVYHLEVYDKDIANRKATIEVPVTDHYRYVTIAAMTMNTNDGFVALNGMEVYPGDKIYGSGYDAGSEANNELCSSIPGPACEDIDSRNESSGNGEGVVHIHRGFHGIGDLQADLYDWRNPMMQVSVSR